ncbi:MAG TPA: hypothetical protein DCL35_07655 [Candidatus Omnitrophica bacterium]|nr:hypothetical protein [Candidatus Omnitrophota bacterium]
MVARVKNGIFAVVLCLSIMCLGGSAFAGIPESDTTFLGYCKKIAKGLDLQASGSLDFYSKYVWRGFTLDKDPVLQPSFSLSAKGFTFTFWSSSDVDNNDGINSGEIDLVFDYTKTFGILSVSVGHTYYDFPGTNGYSKEFYIGAGLCEIPGLGWPITLGLKYYRDYGDQNHGGGLGNYLEASLGYSMTLLKDPEIGMDLGVTNGYNHNLFMAGDGGQTTLSVGFSIPLTENLTLKPKLNYTIPYGDLADDAIGNQDKVFWGGFSMSYSF